MKVLNLLFVSICFLCALSVTAEAYSNITVTRQGPGVFTASATDLASAGAVDFTVLFDPAVLSNPDVKKAGIASGSDVTVFPSVVSPGVLRVVVFSVSAKGISGTGQIATISFSKVGTAADKLDKPTLQEQQAKIISVEGTSNPVDQLIGNGFDAGSGAGSTSTPNDTSKTSFTSTPNNAGDMSNIYNKGQQPQVTSGNMSNIYNQGQQQSGTNLGTVTFSGDSPVQQNPRKEEQQRDEPRREERKVDAPQEMAQSTTPSAATAPATSVQADTVKSPTVKSAKEALALLKAIEMPVQRFRSFKGTRTVKGFVPLFDASAARKAGVVQVPEIAVSDGKKMVTVKIELAASGMVPNFSLRGANLKSIRPITDKVWMLDALPQKGKYDVQLSVLLGGERVDIPLVVIPPLDAAVIRDTQGLSDAGVGALLAKAESKPAKPAYDLNSDGRQDFLDDYILVAHHLLKMQKTDKPAQRK